MLVSQPVYGLQKIACLPCTSNISLQIWKCQYIIQLSISSQLTCNCPVVTGVFETEPCSTCQIEIIFVHIACNLMKAFATYDLVFTKSALVSVLGNFLVNSKCLHLL